MDTFKKALAFTLKWEGGYSNHASDIGGRTNHGITQTTLNTFQKNNGLPPRSVIDLSKSDAELIYKDAYWVRLIC